MHESGRSQDCVDSSLDLNFCRKPLSFDESTQHENENARSQIPFMLESQSNFPELTSCDECEFDFVVSLVAACGSIDCPWVITAEPGQKIHLHLYDFDTYYSESGSYVEKLGNEFSHTCHVYVIIKEKSNTMTSCAEGVRERYVYTSTTNRVEIRVVTKKKIENVVQAQFMLKYTGWLKEVFSAEQKSTCASKSFGRGNSAKYFLAWTFSSVC